MAMSNDKSYRVFAEGVTMSQGGLVARNLGETVRPEPPKPEKPYVSVAPSQKDQDVKQG